MTDFEAIWARAAERKGGEAALTAMLGPAPDPDQLRRTTDDRLLSTLCRFVMSAGFNWKVVEKKWPAHEAAFHDFVPGKVALMADEEVEAAMRRPDVIGHAAKLRAMRDNGVFFCDLAAEHGSAATFFADWPEDDLVGLWRVLKKRGARLGGTTGQYGLRFIGKDCFILSRDVVAALIDAGVVTKPPTAQRDLAAVQAAFNRWHRLTGRSYTHLSRILAFSAGENRDAMHDPGG